MTYTIYADGSYSTELSSAGCAYLILTENTYVNCDSVTLNCKNPTHAEILAVGEAVKYLLANKHLTPNTVVAFNTDCAHVIEFYNKYACTGVKATSRNSELNACVVNMIKLQNLCKVRICKVRGHKNVLNPNTVVDRLAKIARG